MAINGTLFVILVLVILWAAYRSTMGKSRASRLDRTALRRRRRCKLCRVGCGRRTQCRPTPCTITAEPVATATLQATAEMAAVTLQAAMVVGVTVVGTAVVAGTAGRKAKRPADRPRAAASSRLTPKG